MNNKKRIVLGLMVLALIIPVFAEGQKDSAGNNDAGKTYTMKISHAGPVSDSNDDYVGAKNIKEYVERESDGQIVVEIYSGSQLGNYQEVMEQVDSGVLEVAHTSIGGVTPFVPEMAVVDLQYMIPNDEVVVEMMDGPFFDEMNDAVKGVLPGVTLAGVCDGGRWRSFYTTSTEVKSAEDLKGLKIRTINSPLQQEFTRQVGAAATPVAWSEVYTGLQSELVVGLKIGTADILSNNLDEVIRYGVLDRHTFLFGFYWVSDQFLNSMPEDLQKVVLDGIAYGAKEQTVFNQAKEKTANEEFVKEGGKIHVLTDAERETFLPARDAMADWYVEQYGDKYLTSLQNAIEIAEEAVGK